LRTQKIAGGASSKLSKMFVPPVHNTRPEFPSKQTRTSQKHEDRRYDILTPFCQPRRPQVHRPRPHHHQRHTAPTAASVLQEQEVRPARPPTQADPRHPPPPDQARAGTRHREVQEEARPLPAKEVCRQGVGERGKQEESFESDGLYGLLFAGKEGHEPGTFFSFSETAK